MSSADAEAPPLDVLAHRLAHDIRSPMGVIVGVLDELGEAAPDSAPMLALARRSAHRLDWLARRLDWVTSTLAGTAAQDRSPAALDEVARTAVAAAQNTGARRSVTVSVLPGTDAPPPLPSCRLWRHVYEELLVNALRNATRTVELRFDIVDGAAQVTIEDDGKGIAPERVAGLFDASPDGGLGLWLAHRLVLAGGGRLEHAPAAKGARFVVTSPL